MKKIIDANYFQSTELESYLSSSSENIVVFNDYACMEAYKGNALKSISKSLKIVSQYPNQVEILKGTREIIKITLSGVNLSLFPDQQLTDEFKIFCSYVNLATEGNKDLKKQIEDHGKVASDHFEKMKYEAREIVNGINMLATSFSPEHLKLIKKRNNYPPDLIEKILYEIFLMTEILLETHPDVEKPPTDEGIEDCYVFRYALSAYLLILRWISDGGPNDVKLEKLRNDIVDMSYVAYATYFDGLLSNDKKMNEIFEEANFLINNVFKAGQTTELDPQTSAGHSVPPP